LFHRLVKLALFWFPVFALCYGVVLEISTALYTY